MRNALYIYHLTTWKKKQKINRRVIQDAIADVCMCLTVPCQNESDLLSCGDGDYVYKNKIKCYSFMRAFIHSFMHLGVILCLRSFVFSFMFINICDIGLVS